MNPLDCTMSEPCGRAVCSFCYPVENERTAWSIRRWQRESGDEWVVLRDGRWVAEVYDQRDAEFILRAFVIAQMAGEHDRRPPPLPSRHRRIPVPGGPR